MQSFYLQVADVNKLHGNVQHLCSHCCSDLWRSCCVLVLMIIKSMNMKTKILRCTSVCVCVCVCANCVCVKKAESEREGVYVNVLLRRKLKGHL